MSHIRTNTLLLSGTVLASLALLDTADGSVGTYNFNVASECPMPLPIGTDVPFKISGTVPNAPSELFGTCAGVGPEATFLWTAPDDGAYIFDTLGSNYDTVLYLRDTDCDGQDLACNDDAKGLLSKVSVQLEAGQVVYIVIDGYAHGGNYVLNISHGY